jgi:hypothetical protein
MMACTCMYSVEWSAEMFVKCCFCFANILFYVRLASVALLWRIGTILVSSGHLSVLAPAARVPELVRIVIVFFVYSVHWYSHGSQG